MSQVDASYYSDKSAVLSNMFGSSHVEVNQDSIDVDGIRFPVVDDVIVLLQPDRYTKYVRDSIGTTTSEGHTTSAPFAADVQYSFGSEWQAHPEILTEHEDEFRQYFDLVDVDSLGDATVCDLGCGSGRWSYYLRKRCRQLILIDFSDAIFVARRNLSDCSNAVFVMGDLSSLPFRNQFADLIICLGVLHHLPTPALAAARGLKPFAPRLLIYVYYALDNRPAYFRPLLAMVTGLRQLTSRIKGPKFRGALSWVLTVGLYVPLVWAGRALDAIGLARFVPLYDTYRTKSLRRIRQDVYDRFFTRIEQRVTKSSILKLRDTFDTVTISPNLPYWHFICEAGAADGSSRPATHIRSGPSVNPLQDAP